MTATNGTPLVEVRALSKRFGGFLALDSLDLTIGPGVIFGLIGPNGAGKSTTMRILATLLQPSGGEARVAGHSVTRERQAVRNLIGYMPDEFGVYDNMKVWEYLDFFAAGYGIGRERRPGLIDDLLALVDLGEKRDGYVEALSRGMKQRLCLARALVHDPQVLMLDEPASGLDPRARIELRELLKELKALGKTILISSHILTELAEMCTHIGIIETGRLLVSGEVGDVLRSLQPHKTVEVRVLGNVEQAIEVLQPLAGVRDVRLQAGPIGVQPTNGEVGAAAGAAAIDVPAATLAPAASSAASLILDFVGDERGLSMLLRALASADVPVIHFAEQASDLEDIFMQVTHGVTQ